MTADTRDDIRIGRLARDCASVPMTVTRQTDAEPIRLTFPLSSETPIERFFGLEELEHTREAVDMQRIGTGAAPLLFNHDWNDPIGMIDAARIEGGRLVVDAHLFATARAQEVAAMIDGGLRNVSVGYQIDEMREDTKRGVFVATRWTPLEGSIVTVPADISVGLGRDAADNAKPVRVVRAAESLPAASAAPTKEQTMQVETTSSPAGTDANVQAARLSAVEAENLRRQAIRNLCQANKIDTRVEAGWIEDGTTLDVVSREILDVQVQRQQGKANTFAALGLTAKETNRYSLFRAIRALHYGARDRKVMDDAAFELECSREVAKKTGRGDTLNLLVPAEVLSRPLDAAAAQRAMATTPGSKGGYLVNVENMGFIDILRNRSVAMSMGARVLSGLEGNVAFARQTGKPSVTWQAGEHVSVTAADQTLGQLSMTPKTAICITDVSEQLLRQSSPSAEAFVMADLAKVIAIDGVDNAVINGTGGAQPLGIKNTTGITSGQDAGTVTYAKVLAFVSTAAGSNAILSNPGFVTNAAGASVLMQKQRFSSTDTPLWEGNMMDGTLVGFRAMASEQLASGNLIFGSFGEIIIGEWGVLELASDTGGTRFNTATVGIRAMWMVDVLLRYPQAFVVSTSLSA